MSNLDMINDDIVEDREVRFMRPKLIALGNCVSDAHLCGVSGAAGTYYCRVCGETGSLKKIKKGP
jgi:hypothetical protein